MIGTMWGREAVLNAYFKILQIMQITYLLSCFKLTNPAPFRWQQGRPSHNKTVINFSYWLVEKMVLCWCQVKIGHLTGWVKLNLEGALISFNGELSHHSWLVNKICWVPINFSLSGIPTYFLTRALRAIFGHTYTNTGKVTFCQKNP